MAHPIHISIKVFQNTPHAFDLALKKYKRYYGSSGLKKEINLQQAYESPSKKKRRKRHEALVRRTRKMRRQEFAIKNIKKHNKKR